MKQSLKKVSAQRIMTCRLECSVTLRELTESQLSGGIQTPASGLGDQLADRLCDVGLTVRVGDRTTVQTPLEQTLNTSTVRFDIQCSSYVDDDIVSLPSVKRHQLYKLLHKIKQCLT